MEDGMESMRKRCLQNLKAMNSKVRREELHNLIADLVSDEETLYDIESSFMRLVQRELDSI